jgi:drug/metabolite transporter (DMT)-like permease
MNDPVRPAGDQGAHSKPELRRTSLLFALLGVYFIWGSTYLAIRLAIDTLPPFLMAGTRFIIAGGILLLWARVRGVGPGRPGVWKAGLLSGVLMFTGGNGAVVWAEQFVPSGMVALLVATVPFWIVLQDWLSGKGPRPGPGLAFGILWGFFGVGMLVTGSEIGLAGREELLGGIFVLFGAFCWSAGSLIARYGARPASAALGNGIQMIGGGTGLLFLALLAGEPATFQPEAVSGTSLLAMGYLVIFGSLIGFSCYIWLLRNSTPAVASTYAYVNPAVALVLGWALASEPLSMRTGLAAFIILSAVLIITTRRTRGAPPRA